jgi:uncharacterized membrane protein
MRDVTPDESNGPAGRAIIHANAVLTAVFVAVSLAAAVVFANPWKQVAVGVSLACFAVGVVAFLWGYWNAVQRSREDNIGVAALYFLLGGIAPRGVALRMNTLLGVQTVWSIATAVARGSTDGKPGSTLAFGILVPMMGLGLNGLWGAFHGTFEPRATSGRRGVSPEGAQNGQDESHE